jgi:hypothetical protein
MAVAPLPLIMILLKFPGLNVLVFPLLIVTLGGVPLIALSVVVPDAEPLLLQVGGGSVVGTSANVVASIVCDTAALTAQVIGSNEAPPL